jgi:hypothetical protein
LALIKAGIKMAINRAMIEMTTSSSIRVKALFVPMASHSGTWLPETNISHLTPFGYATEPYDTIIAAPLRCT